MFILVVTWTGFPPVFEAVMSTAWIALTLVALGIVARGAAFAIRKPTHRVARRRHLGIVFGLASVLTPFFLAATLGGIASGRIPPGNRKGDPVTSWLNPTSVLFGVLGLLAAAFIAAAFLVSDARRFKAPDLEAYFRTRAVVSGGLLLAGHGGWPPRRARGREAAVRRPHLGLGTGVRDRRRSLRARDGGAAPPVAGSGGPG